jgi:hypothetical protein
MMANIIIIKLIEKTIPILFLNRFPNKNIRIKKTIISINVNITATLNLPMPFIK